MDNDKEKDDELTPEELEELNEMLGLEGEECLTNTDLEKITKTFNSLFSTIASTLMSEPVKTTTGINFKVDTSKVYDRPLPYEIAICHKNFNNGAWVVVGTAKTKEEAIKKHDMFVSKMMDKKVTYLRDIYENIFYLEDVKS